MHVPVAPLPFGENFPAAQDTVKQDFAFVSESGWYLPAGHWMQDTCRESRWR